MRPVVDFRVLFEVLIEGVGYSSKVVHYLRISNAKVGSTSVSFEVLKPSYIFSLFCSTTTLHVSLFLRICIQASCIAGATVGNLQIAYCESRLSYECDT